MAGENPGGYSFIDSGKVLNKEGLLELCSQIKTEIANNSGGGGSSKTADPLATLFFILLKNSIVVSNIQSADLYKMPSTKNDCVDALLNGYIVLPQTDITITQSDLGLSTNFQLLDFWQGRNDRTFLTTGLIGQSFYQLKQSRFYYYSNKLLVEYRNPVDIWSQLPLYTPDSTFSTLGAYLTTLSTRIPVAPTTDGTYTLQCVVSSGTPTYSWVAV